MTHPLASSAVAWGTGVSTEAKDALKRDKYGRTDTGACRFVPLSHETYGRAGPPAFALLHELAEFAASIGAVSKNIFMENAMRDLCRCVPAEAGGVYGVVRLSPPPQPARLLNQPGCIAAGLRSRLRWLKRSGDDPVGCGC